jgi:hypothetical protein
VTREVFGLAENPEPLKVDPLDEVRSLDVEPGDDSCQHRTSEAGAYCLSSR